MSLRDLRTILTLRCEGAARLLSDAEDRRLIFAERLALSGHLLACIWCRRYRAQLRLLAQLAAWRRELPHVGPPINRAALSEVAKERIRARIAQEIDRRRGSP